MQVLAIMLRERSCLFVSHYGSVITEVMESLRALLFPLDWQLPYVPRLPRRLNALLSAPSFLLGFIIEDIEDAAGGATLTADRERVIADLEMDEETESSLTIVYLDHNHIDHGCDEDYSLPVAAASRLRSRLERVVSMFRLEEQRSDPSILRSFESAFELARLPFEDDGTGDSESVGALAPVAVHVRNAYLEVTPWSPSLPPPRFPSPRLSICRHPTSPPLMLAASLKNGC